MPDIVDLLSTESALAIGAAIAAGRVTSIEVTEWYLERISGYRHPRRAGYGWAAVRDRRICGTG